MFEKFRRNSSANRLIEEQLFEQVVFEVSQGELRPGLWAKALANGGGSEQKAKSLYIQYRVQSIKDELKVSESIAEEANKIAESEYNKKVDQCMSFLQSKGYQFIETKPGYSGWIISNPQGGCDTIRTLGELESYAKSNL